MKAEYINPFILSIEEVFRTMLQTSLQRKETRVGQGVISRNGETVSSVIGISGVATGVVALCFPRKTALGLAGRFLQADPADLNGEVADALAELANMVGGSAKSRFDFDPPPELSLPTVLEGDDYRVKFPTKSVWVEIEFDSPEGGFIMDVSFSQD